MIYMREREGEREALGMFIARLSGGSSFLP